MSNYKELADIFMKEKKNPEAIEAYTRAFQDTPAGSDTTEVRRVILANRALAYLRNDDIYNALQDCNSALSTEFTNVDSPQELTAKCHLRRAKAKYYMTLYAEAREDYRIFEELSKAAKHPISTTDKQILKDIMTALAGPKNRSEKTKIIRAVQTRGIILENKWRRTFPKGPANDVNFEDTINFDEDKPQHLSILFHLTVPKIEDPRTGSVLKMLGCLPEYLQVKDILGALVVASSWDPDVVAIKGQGWGTTVIDTFMPPSSSSVILVTWQDRYLKVPLTTRIGEIWARARWPRDGMQDRGFEDLRSTPRARPHEVDGAFLHQGYTMRLILCRNEHLQEIVQSMEYHTAHHQE